MTTSKQNQVRNRSIVWLIVLIGVLPFGFAWYLAKNPHLVKDQKRGNYGRLVTPARPFDYAELLRMPIAAAENLPEIKGRWVMVHMATGSVCNDRCKKAVEKTARVRLMLNKEIPRVRRLLFFTGKADVASVQELAGLDPTLLMAGSSDGLNQRLQEAIGAPIAEGMVLLLDPFANLMMWYEADFDPYGMLRDLQRLLRISQIG